MSRTTECPHCNFRGLRVIVDQTYKCYNCGAIVQEHEVKWVQEDDEPFKKHVKLIPKTRKRRSQYAY